MKYIDELCSPEVNGTKSNQHPCQDCSFLSQHDGTIIVKLPAHTYSILCICYYTHMAS